MTVPVDSYEPYRMELQNIARRLGVGVRTMSTSISKRGPSVGRIVIVEISLSRAKL